MLSYIEVYNYRSSEDVQVTLPLGEVTDGIFVKEITGLDPVKATIVSTKLASMDGAQYHSSSREARNITLKLGLEPDWTIEDPRAVRNRLYKYFMPKTTVDFRFVMDDSTAYLISGRVETFESPMFTIEPEVNISIVCFDPDFLQGNTDDQYADVPTHGLYSVSNTLTSIVNNPGTQDTGILFHFSPTRDLTEFSLYNTPPNDYTQQMDFSIPMLAYDTLQVRTFRGDKRIELYRANNLIGSRLYGLSPQSKWIQLGPGDNEMRLYVTGSPLYYLITNYIRHGGL